MYFYNNQLQTIILSTIYQFPKFLFAEFFLVTYFQRKNSPMTQASLHVILLKFLPWEVFFFLILLNLALAGLGPWEHTEFG